uniref:Small ribosomal subunit protein uS3c n=1 Tax=Drosera indica TaxID=16680 RepID=A0A411K3B5_9CARY|nr:ribosomal protein S3 [Drosera indica]
MGKKKNPLGFRVNITQNHYSIWFAQPKNYSEGLQEDQKIRNSIMNYAQKRLKESFNERIGIARIEIKKQIDLTTIIIYMLFQKELIGNGRRDIEELKMNLQKDFNCVNQKLNIAIRIIKKPYGNSAILAEFIALQLKNKVYFRKTLKQAIKLSKKAKTKGIKIQIAGRIDGKEIARIKCIKKGRVPLQTIRAKMDYCAYTVRTIYGILGIKIWIFLGEE